MRDCDFYCFPTEFNETLNINDSAPLCGCPFAHMEKNPTYRIYNTVIIVGLLPILATYGIVGNALNMMVYAQSAMRCSLNTYLAFLAMSDLLITTCAVLMFTLEALRWSNRLAAQIYLSGIQFVFPVAMTAQTCSVYYTVAAGIDCFISVVLKRYEKRCCTVRNSLFVSLAIMLLSWAYNGTRWFEVDVIRCHNKNTNSVFADVCPSTLRENPVYNQIYFLHVYTIVMSIGPLIALLLVNFFVIRAVIGQRKHWARLSLMANARCSGPASEILPTAVNDDADAHHTADTASLICVVALFIFCNALSLIINFVEFLSTNGTQLMNYLVDISNFLVVLNSSVNFFIYVICGRNFRLCFTRMIRSKIDVVFSTLRKN